MNQLQAFRDTVALAEQRGMPELPGSDLGLDHLRRMAAVLEEAAFSPAKLGRWLGWAQCAVVAAGIGVTLDDIEDAQREPHRRSAWPDGRRNFVGGE